MNKLFCFIKKHKNIILFGCIVAVIITIACVVIINNNQVVCISCNENSVKNNNESNISESNNSESSTSESNTGENNIGESNTSESNTSESNTSETPQSKPDVQETELPSENTSVISTVPEKYCASYELNCSQLIVVTSAQSNADISMYVRDSDQQWYKLLATTGFVGVNGVGAAYEGSGMTPAGCYALSIAFGVNEKPDTILDYVQVDDTYYWVDDPESAYYNQFVSTNEVSSDNWESAEHLIDYSEAYAYAIAIDYNTACTPYNGSAIFLHCSLNRPTLGCVSVDKADMLFILAHISEDCHIILE